MCLNSHQWLSIFLTSNIKRIESSSSRCDLWPVGKKKRTKHTERQQGITETHRAAINSSTNKDYVSLLETWDTQHVASRPGVQNKLFKSILLKYAELLSKQENNFLVFKILSWHDIKINPIYFQNASYTSYCDQFIHIYVYFIFVDLVTINQNDITWYSEMTDFCLVVILLST